ERRELRARVAAALLGRRERALRRLELVLERRGLLRAGVPRLLGRAERLSQVVRLGREVLVRRPQLAERLLRRRVVLRPELRVLQRLLERLVVALERLHAILGGERLVGGLLSLRDLLPERLDLVRRGHLQHHLLGL